MTTDIERAALDAMYRTMSESLGSDEFTTSVWEAAKLGLEAALSPISIASPPVQQEGVTDALVKHMVDRFLAWRLPDDFNPDAGISFERDYNQNTPWPARHEPVGTNLFSATQAEAMVRHMLEGAASPSSDLRREVDDAMVERVYRGLVEAGISIQIPSAVSPADAMRTALRAALQGKPDGVGNHNDGREDSQP